MRRHVSNYLLGTKGNTNIFYTKKNKTEKTILKRMLIYKLYKQNPSIFCNTQCVYTQTHTN